MTTATKTRPEFDYTESSTGPGYNAPQKMGRRLWAPMFALALMAWPIGLVLSWVRAAEIVSATPDPATVARLGQLVPAFIFLGFMGIFTAISFAIARILGAFRRGGGEVQQAIGGDVQTLKMPATARVFIAMTMMGMMAITIPVILHFVVAANVTTWAPETVVRWSEVLEGFRRLGTAMYLFAIAFGLGTIIQVLRFQAQRIRGLANEATA